MAILESARAWLAAINPALPALVLVFILWAPQAAIRRWLPRLWAIPASWGPQAEGLRQAWQALPSLAGGALLGALSSGGDPWEATWAAVTAAATPVLHHLLKSSPLPYTGELGKRDKDDDDKTPPRPVHVHFTQALMLIGLLVGCSSHTEPPPCDPASYAHLAATCGDNEAECDRQISEREDFCARRIQGEP